ncbi:hypothetical protein SUBVAR_06948 [Subdoligranulum variabile DSM 15176]|uniref:Uncharacterized protein n=1 Tax=Subdoligranulum variabile DSM 15176 TaxID=411471 RepID=D1PRB9_9FIRM|nr:hypothetical protein SUBVAR_06948 [Subdoligranulum variabile DSM 15176]
MFVWSFFALLPLHGQAAECSAPAVSRGKCLEFLCLLSLQRK